MLLRSVFWVCLAAAALVCVAASAAQPDACEGVTPCDLGGDFTINEIIGRPPHPVQGLCASRCFWEAAVTDSCFEPDAILEIHAPFDPKTGKVRRAAADLLIRETKNPALQRFLKTSGAGYRREFTRVTGQDLLNIGAPPCQ